MNVVGTIFIKDKKILIDKPRKRNTYQMVGGRVEDNETPLEAAIRECREELGNDVELDLSKFRLVMDFDEIATSDGITKIHFFVFMYDGLFKGKMKTSEEIEKFLWYSTDLGDNILSNTLKNEVIPYCVSKKLIK